MPESLVQVPADGTGKKLRHRERTVGANTVYEQYVIAQDERVVSFKGRAGTFRTPGRAGTTGQKVFALHNATGSTIFVDVEKIAVDMAATVVKAVTVLPPIVRLHRFTALPTGGTALAKVATDTAQTSSASLTAWQDASGDGTSGTALAVTIPAGSMIAQEFAPRMVGVTYVAYEPADRMHFLQDDLIELRALEGLVVNVDYVLATQNPITDMWTVTAQWTEYTLP